MTRIENTREWMCQDFEKNNQCEGEPKCTRGYNHGWICNDNPTFYELNRAFPHLLEHLYPAEEIPRDGAVETYGGMLTYQREALGRDE